MIGEKLAQRAYFGKALADLASENPDIVVLDADTAGSTKTSEFKDVCPDRFVECGIAEANMIGVAAGLAVSGKIPFASTFGVFASGRCWEQIRTAVAYPALNVKIVATHCGLSVGPDGATHQALEDIALMRVLPNMTVVVPCDAYETYAATKAIASYSGPVYMRMGRSAFPVLREEGCGFIIGKADVFREGSDVSIISCGQMVQSCMEAAEKLVESGISAEVVNMSTVKPLDRDAVIATARKTGAVVTVEEHSIIGGFGGAVAEYLSGSYPVPVHIMGTADRFGQSGDAEELLKEYGLGVNNIVAAAEEMAKARK